MEKNCENGNVIFKIKKKKLKSFKFIRYVSVCKLLYFYL